MVIYNRRKTPKEIAEEEINRGKAQLKASLMMSRESTFRRCESTARQLLVFNRIIDPSEIIDKIDLVSKSSVEKIAYDVLNGPMTMASIGPNNNLETLDKIQKRLN